MILCPGLFPNQQNQRRFIFAAAFVHSSSDGVPKDEYAGRNSDGALGLASSTTCGMLAGD